VEAVVPYRRSIASRPPCALEAESHDVAASCRQLMRCDHCSWRLT